MLSELKQANSTESDGDNYPSSNRSWWRIQKKILFSVSFWNSFDFTHYSTHAISEPGVKVNILFLLANNMSHFRSKAFTVHVLSTKKEILFSFELFTWSISLTCSIVRLILLFNFSPFYVFADSLRSVINNHFNLNYFHRYYD